jgi:hypothetical protein
VSDIGSHELAMTRWWLLVLPFLAGCGVSTLGDDEAKLTRNECSSDGECGNGTCQEGKCRATQGTFSSVLFEVTPPASMSGIGGVQHLKRIDDLSLSGGGQSIAQNIALARLAKLRGVIKPNWVNREVCVWSNENAVSVIVTPSDQPLGLGTQTQPYTAEATYSGVDGGDVFTFSLNVPAGDYDIYLQPKKQEQVTGCELAPQLYRRNTVPEGTNTVDVPLTLPAPSTLDLRVKFPPGGSIEGWRVDMIDPDTRQPLSNEVELAGDTRMGEAYPVKLFYSKVIPANPEPGRELVRLRPRMGIPAPTILLERSGLELQVPGEGEIDQLQSLPQIVECQGQVVLADSPEFVAGSAVTLSAVKLDQAAGLKAGISTEYSVTVSADEKGSFSAQLFPGTYKVVAVPPMGSGYATGVGNWEVTDSIDLQSGRTIEVGRLVTLDGRVITSGGMPVVGATVSAVASPASLMVNPLVESSPVVPRAGSTQVGMNGAFQLGADPGNYDLSVRPAPGTGFAWFVRPNVNVAEGQSFIELGELKMPLPLSYSGTVTAELDNRTQPIPGALIRAYVYVTSDQFYTQDAGKAASVLQIGETRAGDTGRFELLVPAQFDRQDPAQ